MSKKSLLILVSIVGGLVFSVLAYGEVSVPRIFGFSIAMFLIRGIITSIILAIEFKFSGFYKSKISFGQLFYPVIIGTYVLAIMGKLIS
jgi:hypothetical protein